MRRPCHETRSATHTLRPKGGSGIKHKSYERALGRQTARSKRVCVFPTPQLRLNYHKSNANASPARGCVTNARPASLGGQSPGQPALPGSALK